MMDFATVSSGISAETCAWQPLGWECQWYSEIDPFCNAVLKYHNPGIPNRGDMLKLKRGVDERPIGLLAGGTPCQGFSIAGKRGGMDDDRSKLSLRFLEILSEFDAGWCMWENVFGVLSSNDGRDFGAFLAGLAERGYGYAWRVLDAQYFGVPQRRRRVFVIGYRGGDWRPPAAVLFDSASVSGHTPKSGATWTDIAYTVGAGSGKGCGKEQQNTLITGALGSNKKAAGSATNQDLESGLYQFYGGNNTKGEIQLAPCCNAAPTKRYDFESELFLKGGGGAKQFVRRLTPL